MRQERIVRPRRPRRRRIEPRDRPTTATAPCADHHDGTDEVLRRIDAALDDRHHADRA